MQIKLNDGIILEPIMVTGNKKTVQGALRDTLTFIFPATESMEYLDGLFTEQNCEKIALVGVNSKMIPVEVEQEDGTFVTEYEERPTDAIYNDYTIRCELKKEWVQETGGTANEHPVYEERIFVSMSQRTYTEKQLASVRESVDLLVLESLMGV